MEPDFEGAKCHVREWLTRDLSPKLTYHSLQHTFDDVLPASERLAQETGLAEEPRLLLATAAVFHDTGFLNVYDEHEREGIRIARDLLPGFGYSADQIDTIAGLIAATQMPQRPQTPLEQLLCDADLDVLGRDDFWALNRKLLAELRCRSGQAIPEEEWLRGQTRFLEEHVYFSSAARAARDEGKGRNVILMRQALRSLNGSAAYLV